MVPGNMSCDGKQLKKDRDFRCLSLNKCGLNSKSWAQLRELSWTGPMFKVVTYQNPSNRSQETPYRRKQTQKTQLSK